MPKDLSSDIQLHAVHGEPVSLPPGETIANVDFLRDGQDLYLNSPDGHAIKIEGYFDQLPDIMAANGARLTPAIVNSFLPPQHMHEFAAAGNAGTDAASAGPIGKITEVVGEATIMRGGEKIIIKVGTEVYQGDVVQTSDKGGVNILFADNTTFAISNNAKLAIDEFIYNADNHEGSSFFSMLQGMFVYTSGLIGKDDPGHVGINTPVGSIGIRGTVVTGNIQPEGSESTITIVDGAIVVTNAGGTLEMSSAFDTAKLTGYDTAPADGGQITAAAFTATYGSLAPVAGPTFQGVTDGTFQPPQQPISPPSAPTDGTLNDGTQTQPGDSQSVSPTTTPNTPPPTAPTTLDPSVPGGDPTTGSLSTTTTVGTAAGSTTGSTTGTTTQFSSTSTGFTTTTSGFDSGTTSTGTTTTGSGTTTSGGTTAGGTTTTTTSSGGAGSTTPPPPVTPSVNFVFDINNYERGTPGNISDDGIPLFGFGYSGSSVTLGTVSTQGFDTATMNISVTADVGGASVVLNPGTGNFEVAGNTLFYPSAGTQTATTPLGAPILSFSPSGVLTLDTSNPFALIDSIYANDFKFVVTVTDALGHSAATNFIVQFNSPLQNGASYNIQIGDHGGSSDPNVLSTATTDNISGTTGNDLIFGRDGTGVHSIAMPFDDNFITSGPGGNDVLYGGNMWDSIKVENGAQARVFGLDGNDLINFVNSSFLGVGSFSSVDGGNGMDVLLLGDNSMSGQVFNFTLTDNVKNIEEIKISNTASGTNQVHLSFQDIFDMTDSGHMLTILNAPSGGFLSSLQVDLGSWSIGSAPTTYAAGSGQITLNATYNSQSVTLVIETGPSPGSGVSVNIS